MTDDSIRVFDAGDLDLSSLPPRRHRHVERIAIATNEVKCRGDTLGTIWWQGAQWAVTDHGLECRDGTYFIDKKRLLEEPQYPWPLHMAEKIWVNIDEFTTAWMVALVLHGYGRRVKATEVRQMFATLPPATYNP